MTTVQQIDDWFEAGIEDGATHMIVVVDEFDHDDYPVYVWGGEVQTQLDRIAAAEMQQAMEVYDLGRSKRFQLAEVRAWHVPA
jgi:hypothetical protein